MLVTLSELLHDHAAGLSNYKSCVRTGGAALLAKEATIHFTLTIALPVNFYMLLLFHSSLY